MSTEKSYEFQCPQFVDFLSGAEGSPKEEAFGFSSPAIKDVAEFKVPKTVPKNIRSSRFNPSVKKCFGNAGPSTNATDSVKLTAKKMLSKRVSRSDGAVNVIPKQVSRKKLDFPHHKRSLSESDLRPKKKKATTPMCLKRTINNVKSKRIKSSEDIEMEKIAELQKQMRQHLRANENTMRRQKIKQTSTLNKELTGTKTKQRMQERGMMPVKNPQRDYNEVLEKINAYTKNSRPQVQKEEAAARGHAGTVKRTNILKKTASSSSDHFLKDLIKPMALQRISEATFSKMSINAVIKELPVKKTDAHRGLLFTSARQKLAIRPFNFQDTIRDLSSKSENETKQKAERPNSMQTPRLIRNKENSAAMDSCSTVKPGRQIQKKTEP